MAGSYAHVVDRYNVLVSDEKFPDMIENLGDAYEAIEEMHHMIDILAKGDKGKIEEAHLEYIRRIGGDVEYVKKNPLWETTKNTWEEDED